MRAYRFVWMAVLGGAVVMAAPGPQAPPVKDRKQLLADSRRALALLPQLVSHSW